MSSNHDGFKKDLEYKKVALVKGGMGSEREVSLSTGNAFQKALDELGLDYVVIDAREDFPEQLIKSGADVALLALHGKYAEDGVVQGVCEYLKIPYTGSGVLTSAICMNKIFAKQIFVQNSIPTADYEIFRLEKGQGADQLTVKLPLPFVVKPAREGSSVGVSICMEHNQVRPALLEAAKFDKQILVESYIKGKEVTVALLQGKALTSIEIEPKVDFYTYENKYTAGKTQYHLPARLSEESQFKVKELSEKLYKIFDLGTYGRIDFMVNEKGDPFVIEINTLPGCTPTSLVPQAAKYDGIDFSQLIFKLIQNAHLDYAGVR